MRLKVTLSYNGKDFQGWQIQPKGRTVQDEIEKILSLMHKAPTTIYASGRTDAGVHALNQVFHFDSNLNIDPNHWKQIFNRQLPDDIFVNSVEAVSDLFHARFDAKFKTYRYKINVGEFDVFTKDTLYQYNKPLSIDTLKKVSNLFIGKHDFTSFNKTELTVIKNQVKEILSFDIYQEDDVVVFEIKGTGFLRHMIRMLVASCIAYHEGNISLEMIEDALHHPDKTKIKFNIPGTGLYLVSVDY